MSVCLFTLHSPMSLSSSVHTDGLEYDPDEHEHGLLPAPIHVGKFVYVSLMGSFGGHYES